MKISCRQVDRLGRVQLVDGHHEHAIAAEAHDEGVESARELGGAYPIVEALAFQFGDLLGLHQGHVGEELEWVLLLLRGDPQPVENDLRVEVTGVRFGHPAIGSVGALVVTVLSARNR